MANGVGHRGRMSDQAVQMAKLLEEHHEISLRRIATELEVSERTARWLIDSFSDRVPLRLERGIVVIEKICP